MIYGMLSSPSTMSWRFICVCCVVLMTAGTVTTSWRDVRQLFNLLLLLLFWCWEWNSASDRSESALPLSHTLTPVPNHKYWGIREFLIKDSPSVTQLFSLSSDRCTHIDHLLCLSVWHRFFIFPLEMWIHVSIRPSQQVTDLGVTGQLRCVCYCDITLSTERGIMSL